MRLTAFSPTGFDVKPTKPKGRRKLRRLTAADALHDGQGKYIGPPETKARKR